jgi:hypothetical protein
MVRVSPDHREPVRVEGRWGLPEASAPADVFEVSEDGAIAATLARKPDAQVAARGGTRTVRLPESRHLRSSLDDTTVGGLAALARAAAATAGQALSLDVVLGGQEPVVLRCLLTPA